MTLKEAWNGLLDRIKNYAKIFEDKEERTLILKQLGIIRPHLVPPTEDEVCKALSECEDLDKRSFITYIPEDKSFTLFKQFRADDCYETDLVRYEQGTIHIANYYPSSVVTLIGRFYEGLEELK